MPSFYVDACFPSSDTRCSSCLVLCRSLTGASSDRWPSKTLWSFSTSVPVTVVLSLGCPNLFLSCTCGQRSGQTYVLGLWGSGSPRGVVVADE